MGGEILQDIVSSKRKYLLAIPILLLALILNTSYVLADQQAVPPGNSNDIYSSGPPPAMLPATLPTYAMTLAFSPNSFSLARGASRTVSVSYQNTGSKAFVATGCKTTIQWSTGKIVHGTCTFSTFKFKPGVTYAGKWIYTITARAPLGISTWTTVLTGTVGGTPYQSQAAVVTITVT